MSGDHEGDPRMTGSVDGDDVCAGGRLVTPTLAPPCACFNTGTVS